jgi:uncharacterized HAD superfamily protein
MSKWRKEITEIEKCGAKRQNRVVFESKQQQLQDFKEKLQIVMNSIDKLEEGIELSMAKIKEANEYAFTPTHFHLYSTNWFQAKEVSYEKLT